MPTVCMTVSACELANEALENYRPIGSTQQGVTDTDAATIKIINMIGMCDEGGVKVLELTETRIVLYYDHNVTDMFGTSTDLDEHYGYLYTFVPNGADADGDLSQIYDTLYALCVQHSNICSHLVESQLAEKTEDDLRRENHNLRAALWYYAEQLFWKDTTLNNPYSKDCGAGQPWRTAMDALRNESVLPPHEAVKQTIESWYKHPASSLRRTGPGSSTGFVTH